MNSKYVKLIVLPLIFTVLLKSISFRPPWSLDNVTAINVEKAIEKGLVSSLKLLESRLEDKFEIKFKELLENKRGTQCSCQDATAEQIKSAVETYHADQTGLPDYASSFQGGRIISILDTRPYLTLTRLFGIPFRVNLNPPEMIITRSVMPGQCWAFQGSHGEVDIALARPAYVSGIAVEHVSRKILIDNDIRSAPKQFSVWGKNPALKPFLWRIFSNEHLATSGEKPELLGRFQFSYYGESLQHFHVKPLNKSFSVIHFKIEDNHGNDEFTCVYRLRVHGHSGV